MCTLFYISRTARDTMQDTNKDPNKKLIIEWTHTGAAFVQMPCVGTSRCSVCNRKKGNKAQNVPFKIGTPDSYVKDKDGSIAKLSVDNLVGLPEGASLLFLFPLDACNNQRRLEHAYEKLKENYAERLAGFAWSPKLYQCSHCRTYSNHIIVSEDTKRRYCSIECQRKD